MISSPDRNLACGISALLLGAKVLRDGAIPVDQPTITNAVSATAAIINQVDKHLPPRERKERNLLPRSKRKP